MSAQITGGEQGLVLWKLECAAPLGQCFGVTVSAVEL
jgi:hypothetical protein